MVATALAGLLETDPGIRVCAIVATYDAALAVAEQQVIDVALVDQRLAGSVEGVVVVRDLLALGLVRAAAMVTSSVSQSVMIRAIEAGATGFVVKNSPAGDLIDVVTALGRGESCVSADQIRALAPRLHLDAAQASSLTSRDCDILQCLAEGLSNPEIAERLFLAMNTVRNYVQGVLRKLGAHSKLEAVAIGYRLGVIDVP